MNTDFVLFAVLCVTRHPGGESFSAPFVSFWFGASPCLLSATVAMCLPFQDVYVCCIIIFVTFSQKHRLYLAWKSLRTAIFAPPPPADEDDDDDWPSTLGNGVLPIPHTSVPTVRFMSRDFFRQKIRQYLVDFEICRIILVHLRNPLPYNHEQRHARFGANLNEKLVSYTFHAEGVTIQFNNISLHERTGGNHEPTSDHNVDRLMEAHTRRAF